MDIQHKYTNFRKEKENRPELFEPRAVSFMGLDDGLFTRDPPNVLPGDVDEADSEPEPPSATYTQTAHITPAALAQPPGTAEDDDG